MLIIKYITLVRGRVLSTVAKRCSSLHHFSAFDMQRVSNSSIYFAQLVFRLQLLKSIKRQGNFWCWSVPLDNTHHMRIAAVPAVGENRKGVCTSLSPLRSLTQIVFQYLEWYVQMPQIEEKITLYCSYVSLKFKNTFFLVMVVNSETKFLKLPRWSHIEKSYSIAK